MTTPSVSVVVPCFDNGPYLRQCLESVLAQSRGDLELIVVDDGSQDETEEIVRDVAAADERVDYVKQANRGASAARNTGIRRASGRYVALLDGDDYWHEKKLELQVAHLETRPEISVGYCGTQFISVDGRMLHTRKPKLTNLSDWYLYCRNPITNGSTPIFRREVFEKHLFDEDKPRHNDVDCWLRIAFTPPRPFRFEGIPEVLTYYRITPGSLSDKLDEHLEACRDSWRKSFEYAPEVAADCASMAEAFQLRNYARRAISRRNMKRARHFVRAAIAADKRILYHEGFKTWLTIFAAWLPLPERRE